MCTEQVQFIMTDDVLLLDVRTFIKDAEAEIEQLKQGIQKCRELEQKILRSRQQMEVVV